MYYLYHGGGADITEIGEALVSDDEWHSGGNAKHLDRLIR
jgi:hypothetical protein